MKKIGYLRLTQIVLAVLILIFLSVFAVLSAKENSRKKALEAELQTAIDNAVSVCTSYDQKIEIKENLKADLDIYTANIQNTDSMDQKAYYANIMLTYVQNRVNMNDPESLYELALELGNAYEASAEDISSYRMYKEEITNAFDKFKVSYNKYKDIN